MIPFLLAEQAIVWAFTSLWWGILELLLTLLAAFLATLFGLEPGMRGFERRQR